MSKHYTAPVITVIGMKMAYILASSDPIVLTDGLNPEDAESRSFDLSFDDDNAFSFDGDGEVNL